MTDIRSKKEKEFFSYDKQIEKLLSKKLVITDKDYAVSILKKLSYFNLINGYKSPFKLKNRDYKPGTTFEDIVNLYEFDDNLRKIFLKNILIVEIHIKSLLSYYFCEHFEEKQSEYLIAKNYNPKPKYKETIEKLIGTLKGKIEADDKDKPIYVKYYQDKHKNVPLWVLVKTLTIGNISKMYSVQKDCIKAKIAKEIDYLHEDQVETALDVLTKYRNVCAHNERLFDYKSHKKFKITTKIHQSFAIKKDREGTSLFDVVIYLKYFLSDAEFQQFINDLTSAIEKFVASTKQIKYHQLITLLSFPQDWKKIKYIKLE